MFKIYNVGEASASILLRETALEPQVPEAVQAGIRRVFGQDLSPKTVVARLLADVQERGDDALREWSARIDGAMLKTLVIDEKQIQTAVSRIPPDLTEALELAADLVGCVEGPGDLSTNPTYMEGFGE